MSSKYYAGMMVFDPKDGMVIGASDVNYPRDIKLLGGMFKDGDNDPAGTAIREALEEGQTQVVKCTLGYAETISGPRGDHKRFFYLADTLAGTLEKGVTWKIQEKDANGRITEEQIARWVPLRELADRLFFKQRQAFGALLSLLASRDPGFFREYQDLLRQFPEPAEIGLDTKW